MDLVENAVYPKGQLLSSVYGLNRTYSKKVVVGLEFDDEKRLFVPKVRLIGIDFIGIVFNQKEWDSLIGTFMPIEDYFENHISNFTDRQIVGANFSLRFTTAHSDKAIQIEELMHPKKDGDCGQMMSFKKTYRRSIVMKRSTFEKLRHVTDCVRAKLEYLSSIQNSVEFFADQLGKHYLEKLNEKQEAQYTVVSKADIFSVGKLTEADFHKFAGQFQSAELQALNKHEMIILAEELLFAKVEYLAFKAQNNIVYQ